VFEQFLVSDSVDISSLGFRRKKRSP